MAFKNFRIIVITSILAILVLCLGLVYFALMTPFWLVSFWFGVAIVAVVLFLIKYVNKWRMQLSDFLLAISHDDFTGKYNDEKSGDTLETAYSKIIEVFQKLRTEKELNHLYLQTIVEHINIALVCLDSDENIVIANQAAKKMFDKSHIKHLTHIKQFDQGLFDQMKKLKPGKKTLVKLKKKDYSFNITMHLATFKLLNESYQLLSFQDIKAELEEQELDSWKKLVRVLTHEIMNTAIPISTLASVINQMLMEETGEAKKLSDLDTEEEEDLVDSLKTIEKRSKGLVEFVRVTKSYTSLSLPKLRKTNLNKLISQVLDLHKPEFESKKIKVVWEKKQFPVELKLDSKLIEQVLINILRNAIEALEKTSNPQIEIKLVKGEGLDKQLKIKDNGCGMNEETLENLFIPFFTTKTKGSGIGLSLSKQIMKMHDGTIEVQSEEGLGSSVILNF